MVYRLSVAVNIDPAGAKSGGADAQASLNQIKASAEGVRPSLAALGSGYASVTTTVERYRQVQNELRASHASGKVSSDEMTAALQRERQAILGATDALKSRNQALAGVNDNQAQFRRQNLTYQLFDIGTSAYGGAGVGIIAAQQLPQIIQLYAAQGGLNAALKDTIALLGGVARAFGPVAIAGAALYGIYELIQSYSAKAALSVDSATAALAAQAAPIDSIKGSISELTALHQKYIDVLRGTAPASNEGTSAVLADLDKEYQARRQLQELDLRSQEASIAVKRSELAMLSLQIRQQIAQAVNTNLDLQRQGFSDPRIGRFTQVPDSITALDQTRKLLEKNPLTDEAKRLQANIDLAEVATNKLKSSLGLLGSTAQGQIDSVNALRDALKELSAIGGPAFTQFDQIVKSGAQAMDVLRESSPSGVIDEEKRRRLVLAQQRAVRRLENQNPILVDADGVKVNVPAPTARPNIELEGLPGFDKAQRASESAAKSAANSYRDLIKSADDRVAQMKLEADAAGENGIAADVLRFKLDLLQKGEEKGRSLSPAQVEAVNQRVEAFKKYAEAAGNAKAKADLVFEREQLGRSSIDQVIASTQRSAGLPIDFNSDLAGMIRLNEQLKESRELAGDFVDTFFGGIEQGKGILESLGDGAISVLKRIGDSLLNNVLNNVFAIKDAASGSGSGGGLFDSLLGGLGSLFGGGSQYSKAASGKIFGLFDRGGYTGPGGIHEPRGVVHAGEVVFSQRDVARHGGVATVEAMRLGLRGYAGGGAVDVQPLLPAGRSAQSKASSGPMQVNFNMTATIAGQGDRELQANLQAMTEQMMRDGLDQFRRNVLPGAVAKIQNDPYAVGA